MKRISYFFLSIAISSATAQEAVRDTAAWRVALDEVVVTGTGTAHRLQEAPVRTEIISGRDLERFQGRSIEDILGNLTASLTFNASDMGSGIQMNGLSNDYILILINGKRMNGDVGGQNDLARIDPSRVERIEIVRGAASALYGSDAIAGVINFILKKTREPLRVESETRAGAHGDIRQSASLEAGWGKWHTQTAFHVKHTDGWRNTDQEWDHHEIQTGSVTKTVNRSTNLSLSEAVDFRANEKLSLSASATYYQRATARLHGPYKYYAYDHFYQNVDASLGARYALHADSYLALDLSYGKYAFFYDYNQMETTDFFDEATGLRIIRYPGERILQTDQRQLLAHLKGVFRLGEKNLLSAGVEYLHQHLWAPHRMVGEGAGVFTLSPYAQDEWNPTERLNLTAGLRMVVHQSFGLWATPSLAALYRLGGWNLRASYAWGFKAPTLKELHDDYVAQIGGGPLKHYLGNEDLSPQKSQYVSAGVEYHQGRLRLSVTGFYNHLRDMIALVETTPSASDRLDEIQAAMRYENLARGRVAGAELSLRYEFEPGFSLSASYVYNDAKAQYTDDPSDPNYMRFTPLNGTSFHNANWSAGWRHDWKRYGLGLSLFGRYSSKRYYLTDGDAKPYQLWRLDSAHRLIGSRRWDVVGHVGVDNLFNFIDRTPFGRHRATTSPGRSVYVSLSLKFKDITR